MIINPYTLIFYFHLFFCFGFDYWEFLNVVICRMNTRRSLGAGAPVCLVSINCVGMSLFHFLVFDIEGRCQV